jgi:filamentous hemagglutinin family protein
VKTKNLFVIISSLLVSNFADALPQGGNVVGGNATIAQSSTQTTITQSSQNAVINWNGFDTASNESVVFNQPNSSSNTLNRINSGLPTNFAGSLTANGNVFILNSSGILFAKGSKVDVAGLIATTLDINNNDFMSGTYKFTLPTGSENSSIINNGTLTAEDKGVIALIAPNVQNGDSGIIQANLGTVELATGKSFVLDFNGDQLINFDSSSLIQNGHIDTSGMISATGGKILMTNNAVSQTLDNIISVAGTVEANAVVSGQYGEVILTNTNNAINVDGNLSSSTIHVNAGTGITVKGAIVSNGHGNDMGGNVAVETTQADIAISGTITSATISLTADTGDITESNSGGILGRNLSTYAFSGISLNSTHNQVENFYASNTNSGNIDFQNTGSLNILSINQNGGDLTINNTGSIIELGDMYNYINPEIDVSGTANFISHGPNSDICIGGNDNFSGPINITSDGNVTVSEIFSIELGNISTLGNLNVYVHQMGSITQYSGTSLNVAGYSFFETMGDVGGIRLINAGNKLVGPISLGDNMLGNDPVSLHNSIATTIATAQVGGVLTIISDGTLTMSGTGGPISSNATDVPNGHSIILVAAGFNNLGATFSPGANNSWLIYLPNPTAVQSGSQPVTGQDKSTSIWNQPYSPISPASIPVGNHFVYARHQA